jgi:hypothetical protein
MAMHDRQPPILWLIALPMAIGALIQIMTTPAYYYEGDGGDEVADTFTPFNLPPQPEPDWCPPDEQADPEFSERERRALRFHQWRIVSRKVDS